ncbi:MAG: hypothetical protein KDI90_05790 [Alphaproteobacteria bacterium]|nr:hypothetical protein [Alphaproteobacteria bacterium]MCB9974299.1 hypothetical protein [Rhodospirillales bacterium]
MSTEEGPDRALAATFGGRLNFNTFLNLQDTPEHRALLDRALKELIPSNFDKDEGDEALKLVGDLQDAHTYKPEEDGYVFTVAGENLDDPEKAVIKGLAVGAFFPGSNTGALWYLVTDENQRGQGIGRYLTTKTVEGLKDHAQIRGGDLNSLYAHIHDPRLGRDPADPYDAHERVKFYSKIDARAIPIDFLDPDKMNQGGSARPYLLISVPVPGKPFPPEKDNIASHIHDYWECYGYENPEQYPEYQGMMERLDQLKYVPPLRPEEYLYPESAADLEENHGLDDRRNEDGMA